MMKNKETKSLVEIWEWKEKIYNKIKNMKDKSDYFKKNTNEVINRLGLEKVSIISR